MYIQDPYTGEWFEDTGLPEEQIPDRPSIVDSELGGSYVGGPEGKMTERGMLAKAMLDYEPPPPPPPTSYTGERGNMGEYDPETDARIEGYGKRLMLRKPGQEEWLTPGGEVASPEYVQDVQSTLKAVDSGDMSEEQLAAKIRPPGQPPTETQMTEFQFMQVGAERRKQMAASEAQEARKQAESRFQYSDVSLMKPNERVAHERWLTSLEKNTYDRTLNDLEQYDSSFYRNKRAQEQQKERERRLEEERDKNREDAVAQREKEKAEKAAERAGKISDVDKEILGNIDAAKRDLRSRIRSNEKDVRFYPKAKEVVEQSQAELAELLKEENEILSKYKQGGNPRSAAKESPGEKAIKKLTKGIALQYKAKHKTRAEAEAAAKRDGYVW